MKSFEQEIFYNTLLNLAKFAFRSIFLDALFNQDDFYSSDCLT